MFDFIKIQYDIGRLTVAQVLSFVGRYLTQEQADEITREE